MASCFTDFAGEFSLVADSSLSKTIRVSCLGYETVWQSLPLTGSIVMAGDSRILSGVDVTGKRSYAKRIDSDFEYDFSTLGFVTSKISCKPSSLFLLLT